MTGTPTATGTIRFTITASNTVVNNTIAGARVRTARLPQFHAQGDRGFTPSTKTFAVGPRALYRDAVVAGHFERQQAAEFLSFDPTSRVLSGTPPAGSGASTC